MLNASAIASILQAYPQLHGIEQYHLRKRLCWCPYDEISQAIPSEGIHLDIGCGFGHFLVYLTQIRPKLLLIGCDPDRRKIALARTSAQAREGRISFSDVACEKFGGIPEKLTSISLLDVLYLMPLEAQRRLLAWASARLVHNGVLVIKALDIGQGLRSKLAVWQEFLMATVLRRTLSSGTWRGGQSLLWYEAELQTLGFEVHARKLGDTRTPALLICARKCIVDDLSPKNSSKNE